MERSIKVLLRTNGGFLRKSPLKLDPLKQWKSQEQKPNAWKLSFRRISELVQLDNLQNKVESLAVLKSAQLKWNKAFIASMDHAHAALANVIFFLNCHLLNIFL